MGIPLYFNKITNYYKNTISPQKQKCNRLFLDFNGIIHNVYQNVKHTVSMTLSKAEFENVLIHKVIEYTEYICTYTGPKELVYICIDGVAPLPKIQQQRKRRYLSTWLKLKFKEEGYAWDSNAISPGTEFMKTLNTLLRQYIKNKRCLYEIILSDSSYEGEGEHKIFDYIHYHGDSKSIDVIYGLDADLIMLSIICEKSKKFLLREPQHYHAKIDPNTPFLWFNVDRFKENLLAYYDNKIDIISYVFLCFLIGNDFLPNLTYLGIHNDGITKILNAYITILDNFHSPIIFRNDRDQFQINFITLAQLFETLYTDEDKEMLKLHKTYYDKSMIFKTNKLRLENYGVSHKNESTKQMFDTKNWRLQYYTLLFDMNIYNDNVINTVCESYISGLLWIADYYFNKKTSSNWFYMYNYSPTILDVYNYLEVNKSNITQKKQTYDISSDLQLLMILPIHSKLILPMELQELVSNTSSIGHFYPEDFKIQSYLKTKLHECFPILPKLNINELQIAYLNTIS
jgi:5'-3' exonuclease